jgi:L-ascorbate metabolism protein UlaG (beta-lactamase superfamily)
MLDYDQLEFRWTGHDGFLITDNKNRITIYIDPYQLSNEHKGRKDADIILISHNHFDHLSSEDIKEIASNNTTIVTANECSEKLQEFLANKIIALRPGGKTVVKDIAIEAIRAYNTNKKFHPKEDNKIGFVIGISGYRIYHAGDTDIIPEMEGLNPDFALLPVSGTYVMTADEAAKATNEFIKPSKIAIPMHYGSIVGSKEDADRFKTLVNVCKVEILDRE